MLPALVALIGVLAIAVLSKKNVKGAILWGLLGSAILYYVLLAIAWYGYRRRLEHKRWLLHAGLWSIPFVYLAGQAGWIVAEVGRQPWAIQDLLPVSAAVSQLETASVQTTFFLFLALFTLLLIAEIRILCKAIKGQQSA